MSIALGAGLNAFAFWNHPYHGEPRAAALLSQNQGRHQTQQCAEAHLQGRVA